MSLEIQYTLCILLQFTNKLPNTTLSDKIRLYLYKLSNNTYNVINGLFYFRRMIGFVMGPAFPLTLPATELALISNCPNATAVVR